jgi:hypothetical protein
LFLRGSSPRSSRVLLNKRNLPLLYIPFSSEKQQKNVVQYVKHLSS